ncbi:MAG: ZIP family metal transporter [Chloroflexi bacterium]|nr:ZIP family metal transporter [Chloroflexota bacterium]
MDTPRTVPATPKVANWPLWLSALLPLVLLGALVAVFFFTNPLAAFKADGLPPIESISIERIELRPGEFIVTVFNGSPDPLTIAQVTVDDAFWEWQMTPSAELPRLGRGTITIPYDWMQGEPHAITVVTESGTTFTGEVAIAAETPQPGPTQFLAYGLLGVYIGVIPVGLGLLWFPAMRRMGRKGLNFVLALTVGLLVFLLIDTALEAIEVAGDVAGVFQGLPVAAFAALLAWLAILAVSGKPSEAERDNSGGRLRIATLIALSIGLHNLGEGLAVGAAFALGEATLGSFLVIGFTLHNVTEGVGIAAPVTKDRPSLKAFILLCLLAGAPAILGAWIGGFAYSPLLATIFLGVGVGAIWQVIVEVGRLLIRDAEKNNESVANWVNVAGLALGIAVMYFTAYFVKF